MIRSKPSNGAFREGFDRIFGKKCKHLRLRRDGERFYCADCNEGREEELPKQKEIKNV